MKALAVLCPLLWVCALYFAGIYLFLSGFLLVRLEVNRTSTCGDVLQPSGEERGDFCRAQPRFRRAVLLIIDALKMDFARFDPNNTAPRPYENKLPVLEQTVSVRPSHSRLYPFRADPPTTTMQRIKGFTTGSLPTFVDVGNNFASSAILEDNLIHQFGQVGESMRDAGWCRRPKMFQCHKIYGLKRAWLQSQMNSTGKSNKPASCRRQTRRFHGRRHLGEPLPQEFPPLAALSVVQRERSPHR